MQWFPRILLLLVCNGALGLGLLLLLLQLPELLLLALVC